MYISDPKYRSESSEAQKNPNLRKPQTSESKNLSALTFKNVFIPM